MSGLENRPRTPSGWDAAMYRSFSAFLRVLVAGSPSSRLNESDGVIAAIVPAMPERSVFNSVGYESTEALAASLEELALAYEDADVDAWTVWVPETDIRSAELLESAGHRLDAKPEAMLLDLSELGELDPGDLDWRRGGSLDDLATINDAAYGYPPGTFGRALGDTPADAFRRYEAHLDGEPASVLGTLDHDGDCDVLWVATLPEAQGHGLARRLLHLALAEARDRGCATATLQASPDGRPLYRRLAFRELGALQMWERRR